MNFYNSSYSTAVRLIFSCYNSRREFDRCFNHRSNIIKHLLIKEYGYSHYKCRIILTKLKFKMILVVNNECNWYLAISMYNLFLIFYSTITLFVPYHHRLCAQHLYIFKGRTSQCTLYVTLYYICCKVNILPHCSTIRH